MQLTEITIQNFKGIKDLTTTFSVINPTEISGRNGCGKSSVYDAFLWCLFGRDSLGQADFDVEPQDKDGQLITCIPKVAVTVDGHILKRELHDKAPKTRCWVDEVSMSVTAYQGFVASLIDKDVFRMLTDVHHVCGMHHTDRRKLLLTLAGESGTPAGFESLLADLQGRSMMEYKKLVQDEKTRTVKARDQIEPRIDEIQRGLDDNQSPDESAESERKRLTDESQALDRARQTLLNQEADRQKVIDQVNGIRTMLTGREAFLKNDTSRVQELIKEKNSLATSTQDAESALQQMNWSLVEKDRMRKQLKDSMAGAQDELQTCRGKWEETAKPVIMDDFDLGCPTCGQPLPEDQAQAVAANASGRHQNDLRDQQQALEVITSRGNDLQDQIQTSQAGIEKLEGEICTLGHEIKAEAERIKQAKSSNEIKSRLLQIQIDSDVKVKPEDDQLWSDYSQQIEALKVGESVAEQLSIIEGQRNDLTLELVEVNRKMARADRAQEDHERIKFLEEQERMENEKILNLEKKLADIAKYTQAESELIEAGVNGLFKHVRWRMFQTLKNGNVEPCCTPTFKGVAYPNLSYGERILVGLDIVGVLAKHYKVTVPLFVDNAESYTPEIEWSGQVIRLVHKRSQKALKIT